MMKVFIILATTAILFNFAIATDHTVGAPNGSWNFVTDYKAWAASQKFIVGDTLTFTYLSPVHNVLEVSEEDYNRCSASNPIKTYTGGLTTISLDAPGQRYFICGIVGHCFAGMKIEIDTLEGSTTSSTPPPPVSDPVAAPSPPPASPVTPSPASSASPPPHESVTSATDSTGASFPAPPPPSSANKYSTQTSITVGVGMVLMMLLAF